MTLLLQSIWRIGYNSSRVTLSIVQPLLEIDDRILSKPWAMTNTDSDTANTANTTNTTGRGGGTGGGDTGYFDATTKRIKPFFLFDNDKHVLLEEEKASFWRDRICPLKNDENPNNQPQQQGTSTLTYLEGDGGHQILQKIRSDNSTSEQQQQQSASGPDASVTVRGKKTKKKILCMVYTMYTKDNHHSSVESQARTWGRQCDGFFAASNMTQPDINAVNLPHDGEEAYGNMWQKVRSMWSYAYRHYLNEYDYFHIVGEDVYVYVPNMRSYLDGPEVERLEYDGPVNDAIYSWKLRTGQINATTTTTSVSSDSSLPRPVFLGIPVGFRQLFFPAGGPGYTMNRRALEIFGSKSLEICMTDAVDPREDVFVAQCLDNEGVFLSDTRHDDTKGTRYGESAESEYTGKVPYRNNLPRLGIVYNQAGLERVSDDFFSFHLKNEKNRLTQMNRSMPDLIYRYHTVLHGYEDKICHADPGAGTRTS
eukprot:CAMPEP_0113480372 /NCGR_PEP_ID=MMETSP0014_2-20120614/21840_1 /TAXON_ID=2857 /ORGANISM="Nitzschia sp." /LENGTH=479 /DNA_ID=CAMNT_0000373797 /DNA_START=23 /DNA_END=1462 /DNA_ORIENTATION=+ /assembly_acc=CAM_ASM_000159